MSKEEWKQTGKELGHAFKSFGKNTLRSADRVADKVKEDATGAQALDENGNPIESTVFSDGSWKETGRSMGTAFASLGKSLVHTAKDGVAAAKEELDQVKKED